MQASHTHTHTITHTHTHTITHTHSHFNTQTHAPLNTHTRIHSHLQAQVRRDQPQGHARQPGRRAQGDGGAGGGAAAAGVTGHQGLDTVGAIPSVLRLGRLCTYRASLHIGACMGDACVLAECVRGACVCRGVLGGCLFANGALCLECVHVASCLGCLRGPMQQVSDVSCLRAWLRPGFVSGAPVAHGAQPLLFRGTAARP